MGAMTTARIASCSVLSIVALLSACQTGQRRDLTANSSLFRPTGFRTGAPGDRAVFVAPLADGREVAVLPASADGFPITYDPDGRWQRPVREMVQELLQDELRESGLFARFLTGAQPDALVVKPTLVRFHSGTIETMEGARSLAEVALRLQVYGPADAAGRRPTWHDAVYADAQVSGVRMVPVSTFVLTGRAAQAALHRALAGLDGSNVARSGVPLELPGAVETVPAAPGH
jgi:hypothetical protein